MLTVGDGGGDGEDDDGSNITTQGYASHSVYQARQSQYCSDSS